MRPSELETLLESAIGARAPVLITGAPGIGKSEIVHQAATRAGYDMLLSHPVVSDPTDFKGLPWVSDDKTYATFLPFGDFNFALKATKPTVWFLDDLGQAPPSVQAACMQLLLARRVNGHALPECITFVAATNRRTDGAGVTGMLEPVKSRFATIVELKPQVDDWTKWAMANGIPTALIAFIRYRPDLLSKFEKNQDMVNSPCPRTWYNAARIEALGLPSAVETIAMGGAVGAGAAAEYLAFRTMASALQSIDDIIKAPMSAKIPTEVDQRYAICVGLACKANKSNFGAIVKYVQRLYSAGYGDFAVLTVRDAVTHDRILASTKAFEEIYSGELGKMIQGV